MSKGKESITISLSRITTMKAREIAARERFSISGLVIMDEEGSRAIVEHGAVRWLTNQQMWELMHPEEK